MADQRRYVRMKNLIVAVDFSEITASLVDKAAQMAECRKARVYIIHVASPDPEFVGYDLDPELAGYEVEPEHWRELRAEKLKRDKKELEFVAEGMKARGIDAVPLLIQKPTAEGLVEQAEKLEPEMLIMGTHGHGAIMTALLGSTSQNVIKHVKCPVLLVPCKGL